LKLTGQLSVEGDCEYESLIAAGALQVDGLLGAETLELRLHGPARAREVGGGRIQIKRSRVVSLKKLFVSAGPVLMTADLIEGDNLDLEYTHAKVVRGNQVRIGPGCEIERVEYRRSLSKSASAKVGTEAKIE
jgi:cytoskeletal protein CcmA (bactofilin family)